MNTRKAVIAIDFDDTIYNGRSFKKIQAAINALPLAFIVIFTARGEECRRFIKAWCIENGIRADAIECEKLRFDVLIDDRTLNPLLADITENEIIRILDAGRDKPTQ